MYTCVLHGVKECVLHGVKEYIKGSIKRESGCVTFS